MRCEKLRSLLYTHYPLYSDSKVLGFVRNVLLACVEACRFRTEAVGCIVKLVGELKAAIYSSPEVNLLPIDEFALTVRLLGLSLTFQMEELGLYDQNGILQYSFVNIQDSQFNDVALVHIQRLTWNGAFYETNP